MISRLQTLLSGDRADLYAVLDVGTVDAKALLVLSERGQAAIVGAGRQAHQPGAIAGGSLADVALAAKACEAALAQAEAQTEIIAGEKLVADRAIVGISGPMVRSACLTVPVRRPRPQEKLGEAELRSIVQRAERLVLQQAREAADAGYGDVALVDAHVIEVCVDGMSLTKMLTLAGAQVDVRLVNVVVPATYLERVHALVAALEMETVTVLAGSCAMSLLPVAAGRCDAVIVDIGGECTDVVLVRHGGVEDVGSLPQGGAGFTRRIGRTLGVPLAAAEEIKRSYASGRLDHERSAELRSGLAGDVQTWLEGLQAVLAEMARQDNLPPRIYLGGGGAALPDLEHAVCVHPWLRVLSFERIPQVAVLQPRPIDGLVDRTGQTGPGFAAPVSLAAWAAQSVRPQATSEAQRILQQVLHGMGLS